MHARLFPAFLLKISKKRPEAESPDPFGGLGRPLEFSGKAWNFPRKSRKNPKKLQKTLESARETLGLAFAAACLSARPRPRDASLTWRRFPKKVLRSQSGPGSQPHAPDPRPGFPGGRKTRGRGRFTGTDKKGPRPKQKTHRSKKRGRGVEKKKGLAEEKKRGPPEEKIFPGKQSPEAG